MTAVSAALIMYLLSLTTDEPIGPPGVRATTLGLWHPEWPQYTLALLCGDSSSRLADLSPISRRPQGDGTTSRRPRDVVSGTPGGRRLGTRRRPTSLVARAIPVVSKIRPPWTPLPACLPDHPALASRGLAPTRIADMLASLSFIHVVVERSQRPSQGGRREALLIRGAGTYSLKATSTAAGRNTSTRSPTSSPAVCSSSEIARTAFPRRAPVLSTSTSTVPASGRRPPSRDPRRGPSKRRLPHGRGGGGSGGGRGRRDRRAGSTHDRVASATIGEYFGVPWPTRTRAGASRARSFRRSSLTVATDR